MMGKMSEMMGKMGPMCGPMGGGPEMMKKGMAMREKGMAMMQEMMSSGSDPMEVCRKMFGEASKFADSCNSPSQEAKAESKAEPNGKSSGG